MTRPNIEELKALAEKATAGKWGVEDPMEPDTLSIVSNPGAPSYEWCIVASVHSDDEDDEGGPRPISIKEQKANAAFIAAAREAVPALCDYVLELEARLKPLEAAAKEFIRKVDAGEARSKRSYAEFSAALGRGR